MTKRGRPSKGKKARKLPIIFRVSEEEAEKIEERRRAGESREQAARRLMLRDINKTTKAPTPAKAKAPTAKAPTKATTPAKAKEEAKEPTQAQLLTPRGRIHGTLLGIAIAVLLEESPLRAGEIRRLSKNPKLAGRSLGPSLAREASRSPSWLERVADGLYRINPAYRELASRTLATAKTPTKAPKATTPTKAKAPTKAKTPKAKAPTKAPDEVSALDIIERHRKDRAAKTGRDYSEMVKDLDILRSTLRRVGRMDLYERPKGKLDYKDALFLCTALGLPDLRSDLEQAEAMRKGETHLREWDLSMLIPGTSPYPDAPVSFDALIEALGLDRPSALRSLQREYRANAHETLHCDTIPTKGRPRKQYWLSERMAKEFAMDSGISKVRKRPIVDYFVRREEEATTYRSLDRMRGSRHREEIGELEAKVNELLRAVNELQEEQKIFPVVVSQMRLDAQAKVKEKQEELQILYETAWDLICEEYPYSARDIAKAVGAWSSSGNPHVLAVNQIIKRERLGERGTGCAWYGMICDHKGVTKTWPQSSRPKDGARVNSEGLEIVRQLFVRLRSKLEGSPYLGVKLIWAQPGLCDLKILLTSIDPKKTKINDKRLLVVHVPLEGLIAPGPEPLGTDQH